MGWLAARTDDGRSWISYEELREFDFEGTRVPLMDRQRGIRKPVQLEAALSVRTTYRAEGAKRPYEDEMRADGLSAYKWRGTEADHPENRALRLVYRRKLPLIWFFGVGPGLFQAVYPIFLVKEEPEKHQFLMSTIEGVLPQDGDSAAEEILRRYLVSEARQRVHQPVFRGLVMRAYAERCSVCSLAHSSLLDAAHIIPDREERGIAAVRNGLALCKIHHAAYDHGILGIRPDYQLEVRLDVLHEVDGPMLRHGIQEMHGQTLRVLPSARAEKPDPELLEERWVEFRAS